MLKNRWDPTSELNKHCISIQEYLEKGHEFIWNAIGDRSSDKGGDASEGKTSNIALVHCEAGISRSSTTVIT